MAKRARLPSSDEEDKKSESSGKKRKDVKEKKGSKDKDKDKDKHKDKDKKDKEKDKGKDKEKSKDKKSKADKELSDPMEKKAKSDKKEGKESASSAAAPGAKAEKKRKKDGGPPTKELVFSGLEIFRIAAKPFGMELDGALVVDLFDKDSMAAEEGVQIGWQVLSVNGKSVPGEAEGATAKALREAEQAMAKNKSEVRVVFITDEPDHWKAASKKLGGSRR